MHITAKTARISTNDITASRIFLSLRARFAFSSASCFAALSRRLSASVCSKDAPPFTPRAFRALPALRPRALCPAPSTACPGVPTLAWGLSYVFFSAARAAAFSLFRFSSSARRFSSSTFCCSVRLRAFSYISSGEILARAPLFGPEPRGAAPAPASVLTAPVFAPPVLV